MATPAQPSAAAKPPGPPPEVQARIERTIAWAEERFAWYYHHADVPLPSRFGRREFGFMFLAKTFMVRHMAFSNGEEFRRYLAQHAPAHAYYSTAYYENPRAERMAEKGWLGADLIFDLDADHIEAAKDKGFEEMLALIKKEAVKLVHEFLLDDFGFAPEHLRIVFSGGRGYHIHVTDPAVLQLGSAERREIVDYLEGQGLDFERALGQRIVHVNSKGMRRVKEKSTYLAGKARVTENRGVGQDLSREVPGGWAQRIVRGQLELLAELRKQPQDSTRKQLRAWGLSQKKIPEVMAHLYDARPDAEGRTLLERFEQGGGLPTGEHLDKVLRAEAMKRVALAAKQGETDEPVTSDIKRLIRLPGSIHGKTALRVTPIPLQGLEAFDPLRETVAFGDAPVKCVVSKPEKVRLREREWDVQPGPQELPEHVALFVCLRRKATVA